MTGSDIWNYVWQEIWGGTAPIVSREKWYSPKKHGEVWVADEEGQEKYINQLEVVTKLQPYQRLEMIEEVLKKWTEINSVVASRAINSLEVEESDGVYNSRGIYASSSIFDSKYIVGSRKLFDCSYMIGCRDNSACSVGVGVKESIYCSKCWEVSWSNKVSHSAFAHDCYDVSECLFCSHLRSKKYCIANIQLEKEEYFRVKEIVKEWVISLPTY